MKFEKLTKADLKGKTDREMYLDRLSLPTRSTEGSCGYDFHSPSYYRIKPNEAVRIPLCVRVVDMPRDVALFVYNRSGLSLNKGLTLDNGVGVIDSDYHDGIWFQATNHGKEPIEIGLNDRICQGVFQRVVLMDDTPTNKRIGGLGSTGND